MKQIISFLALAITSGISAQNLKITVRDMNEPLAFANVYVNGAYITSADIKGMADIPEASLHPGDTLSSSYLGFLPAFAIYDEQMRSAHACTLVHAKEQVYELENVVVTSGGGGWDAFQKFAAPSKPVGGRHMLRGNFDAQVRMPDNTVRHVAGTFSMANTINRRQGAPVVLTTQSDTTGIGRMLMNQMFSSYFWATNTLYRLRYIHNTKDEKWNPLRTLTYLGIRDGRRDFVITYVLPKIRGTNQVILQFNAETKLTESMYYTTTANQGVEFPINSMTTQCEQYDRDPFAKLPRTKPSKIEMDFKPKNGFKTDLVMSDITIEIVK